MSDAARFRLLYDGRCGLCRRLARLVRRLDRRRNLVLLAFDDPDAKQELGRLPRERRYSAFHLVSPSGEILSGDQAVLPTLDLLRGGRELAAVLRRLPGGERAARATYRWVAQNRASIGRLLGRSASVGGRAG